MKPALLAFLLSSLLLFGCMHDAKLATTGTASPSTEPAVGGGDSNFQPLSGVVVQGSRVSLRYLGSFENGTVFDTNIVEEARKAGLNPPSELPLLNVSVGAGEVIPGFEKALLGMRAGQEKTVTIPAGEAYGAPNPEYIVQVNASDFSQGGELQVGATVATSAGARGLITAVESGTVTVDFNHPLAGKTLVFKIIVKQIS